MTFAEWKAYATRVREMADRVNTMRHDRGFAIAATVGIPRDMCCLHNASIDRNCTGWSSAGPHVHRTARKALRLVDDWSASRIADRAIQRAWATVNW